MNSPSPKSETGNSRLSRYESRTKHKSRHCTSGAGDGGRHPELHSPRRARQQGRRLRLRAPRCVSPLILSQNAPSRNARRLSRVERRRRSEPAQATTSRSRKASSPRAEREVLEIAPISRPPPGPPPHSLASHSRPAGRSKWASEPKTPRVIPPDASRARRRREGDPSFWGRGGGSDGSAG